MIRQGSLSNTGWFLIVATALAAVLFVAGCGGSDDSSASGSAESGENAEITVETGSLSKPQFIKQADAICEKDRAQFEKLLGDYISSVKPPGSKEGEEQLAQTIVNSVVVPVYKKLIDRISALGAPSGDEEKIAAILEAMQRELESAGEEPLKYIRSQNVFAEARKLAQAYGLTYCPE